MADFKLKGLGVALVTPFKKDKTVDFDALKRMVEYIIEGKSDYIVVLGTTGGPRLSSLTKKKRS